MRLVVKMGIAYAPFMYMSSIIMCHQRVKASHELSQTQQLHKQNDTYYSDPSRFFIILSLYNQPLLLCTKHTTYLS